MKPYLLIETRPVWDDPAVTDFLTLAEGLLRGGHPVDLFLVHNAVLMARTGAVADLDRILAQPGAAVWVDEFALAARGLVQPDLAAGIRVAGMDRLVQLLTTPEGKAIWH